MLSKNSSVHISSYNTVSYQYNCTLDIITLHNVLPVITITGRSINSNIGHVSY